MNETGIACSTSHFTESRSATAGGAPYKSKRYVERMVACLRPQPPYRLWFAGCRHQEPTPMPDICVKHWRNLPMVVQFHHFSMVYSAPSAIARAVVAPLAPHRYKLQLTIGQETHDKLRRLQDLLRHSIPTGDRKRSLDRALTLLLAELERTKCAATERPRRVLGCEEAVASRYCNGQAGCVVARTRASAPLSAPTAAAGTRLPWSSITSNHTRLVATQRWRTSHCAVVRTITMRKTFFFGSLPSMVPVADQR